jgi:hypothetical protein
MSSDYRHHHASNPAVILVLPEAGSPKHARPVKPRYPQQTPREHWTGPPRRNSKADAMRRLIENMRRQDGIAREFMRPDAGLLREWLNRAA